MIKFSISHITNIALLVLLCNMTYAQDNPPIADAGPDQINVGFGVNVQMDGANSQSQNDGTLNYRWEQIFGVPVVLTDENSATPSFVSPTVNDVLDTTDKERFQIVALSPDQVKLIFKLTVTDSNGSSASDEVAIILTDSFTSGLKNVALGTRVYLNAAHQDSYAWSLVAPKKSSAELSDDESRNPSFVPDVVGMYTIIENNTRKSITMNVGRWVGVGEVNPPVPIFPKCAQCHSKFGIGDIITPWSLTKHATFFQRAIDGKLQVNVNEREHSYPFVSIHGGLSISHLLPISTVGYDDSPAADNNGFDDVARDLNWTFPSTLQSGNFDAMPEALKELANVQCENCHGPGSEHNGLQEKIGVSFRVGVCAQCHARFPDDPVVFQWRKSKHAHPDSGGFSEVQPINTGDANSVTCAVCHDPHPDSKANAHLLRFFGDVELTGGVTFAADVSAVCVKCHTDGGAQPGSEPKHPQAEMLAGTGGFEYPGETYINGSHTSSIHRKCVGCHGASMPGGNSQHEVGGHTFKMRDDNGTPFDNSDDILLVAGCSRCHGEITSFDFAGTQTRVQNLLDELESLFPLPPSVLVKAGVVIQARVNNGDTAPIPPFFGGLNLFGVSYPQVVTIPYSAKNEIANFQLTDAERKAAFNWLFVKNDGSLGVHNHRYAEKLLSDSIAALKALQNQLPIADAGADTIVFVGDKVNLDGSASFDPEGVELNWKWRFVSVPDGSSVVLADSDKEFPSFIADVPGDYVVELIVNDSKNDSIPDSVTITAQSAEEAEIALQSPTDNMTLSFSNPPLFRWASSGGFKFFVVEFSSTPDFAKGESKIYRIRVSKGMTSLDVRNSQLERVVRVAKKNIIGLTRNLPGSLKQSEFSPSVPTYRVGRANELDALQAGTEAVYWRVKGRIKGGATSISNVFKLNIPPPSLAPLAPPDASVIDQSRITFNWDAVGVSKFRIEFSINPSFPKGGDTISVAVHGGSRREANPTRLTVSGSTFKKIIRLAKNDNDRLFWRVSGRVIGTRDRIFSPAFTFSLSGILFKSEYVGSTTCKLCHEDIYNSWKETLHSKSLRDIFSTDSPDYQNPTDPIFGVLGTFDGTVTLSDPENGIPAVQMTLSSSDKIFKVSRDNETFTVIRTYGGGSGWKQNYITRIGLSHYILPLQWNEGEIIHARLRTMKHENAYSQPRRLRYIFGGGEGESAITPLSQQGWVSYRLGDWFDEKGSAILPSQERSFEVTCAGCHYTGINVSRDKRTGDFIATFTELNVSCETCHGPGGEHFRTVNPASIINPRKLSRQRANEVCGQCHSRGVSVGTVGGTRLGYPWHPVRGRFIPGRKLSDYLMSSGVDWPDGTSRLNYQQFQDYMVGAHGLGQSSDSPTCFDCHNPHGSANEHDIVTTLNGQATRVEDNSLCLSCHSFPGSGFETEEEISAHTRHVYDPEVTGRSRCVLCHAPAIQKSAVAYDIHAHTFYVLAPSKTLEFQSQGGMPNSCAVSCHRALANDDPSRAGHGDTSLEKWDEPTDIELAEYLDEFFRAWWVSR